MAPTPSPVRPRAAPITATVTISNTGNIGVLFCRRHCRLRECLCERRRQRRPSAGRRLRLRRSATPAPSSAPSLMGTTTVIPLLASSAARLPMPIFLRTGGTAIATAVIVNTGSIKTYGEYAPGIYATSYASSDPNTSGNSTGGTATATTSVTNGGSIITLLRGSAGIAAYSEADASAHKGGTATATTTVTNSYTISTVGVNWCRPSGNNSVVVPVGVGSGGTIASAHGRSGSLSWKARRASLPDPKRSRAVRRRRRRSSPTWRRARSSRKDQCRPAYSPTRLRRLIRRRRARPMPRRR